MYCKDTIILKLAVFYDVGQIFPLSSCLLAADMQIWVNIDETTISLHEAQKEHTVWHLLKLVVHNKEDVSLFKDGFDFAD